MKIRLKTKISFVMCLLVISSALLFSLAMYRFGRNALINGIDGKLLTTVQLAHEILTPSYHDSITDASSVSTTDYKQIVSRWNRLCQNLGLEYIWSLTKADQQLVFTSGTATSKTLDHGDYASFFEPHTNPELYTNVFSTMQPEFKINQDKWGRIRAVLVPFTDAQGRPYLIGASIKMADVDAMIAALLWRLTFYSVTILTVGGLASFKLARSISRPIEQLTDMAQRITRGEYISPDQIKGTTEIVSLAQSIDIMEKSIHEKIEALCRKEENLQVTLNSIGDAVIATDTDGLITRMNPVAENLTQWPEHEALGKPLTDIFHLIDAQTRQPADHPVQKVLTTQRIIGLASHTALIARDGTERQIADSAAPIRSADSKIIGVILVFRDVTDEYAIQEQLRQSQKMEAIGQLAGGVAHDFNNLLTGIMSATDLLQMLIPPNPHSKKYLTMIMRLSVRAADLTKKLLAFAQRQPLVSTTVINVHNTLEETAALLRDTIDRRITLTIDLQSKKHHIIGDCSAFQSSILNLGINASHAMPDGGNLTISTRQIELKVADCEADAFDLQPGPHIEINIIDTGMGIATEHMPRIFEPFFTTKSQGKGTGLGLASVFGTIQYHKGSIHVTSEVGTGTRFRLLLPLTDAEPIAPKVPQKTDHGEGLILVVDDEDAMRITTKAILTELGYRVHVAKDGLEGLSRFKKDPAAYDLVLLDMMMPNMNGLDCHKALRKIRPDIPVLLATGYAKDAEIEQMQQTGIQGYIRKPFRAAELSQAIRRALVTGPIDSAELDV